MNPAITMYAVGSLVLLAIYAITAKGEERRHRDYPPAKLDRSTKTVERPFDWDVTT
jgi:hypothetical protein